MQRRCAFESFSTSATTYCSLINNDNTSGAPLANRDETYDPPACHDSAVSAPAAGPQNDWVIDVQGLGR